MIIVGVVAIVVCTCQVSASLSTCGMGVECSSCPDNKVKTFLFRTGEATDVCCLDCSSQYISFGYTRIREIPYCNCDFTRVQGSARKGEECSAPGMTTYNSLNGMPICCADPLVVVQGATHSNGDYVFNCEKLGNCWRGGQCKHCNNSSLGVINDISVCCPDCEGELDIGSNNYCYCHSNKDSVSDVSR